MTRFTYRTILFGLTTASCVMYSIGAADTGIGSDSLQVAQHRQEAKDRLLFSPNPLIGEKEPTTDQQVEKEKVNQVSFFVHTVQWKDLPAAFSFLRKDTEKWQPQNVHFSDIQIYVNRLNKLLIQKGYATTRVEIPNQNIANGILELELWTDTIGKVQSDHPTMDMVSAFPPLSGRYLNLRPIEQGIDVLRSAGYQVQLELVPTADPHVHDILLHSRTDTPLHVQLGMDNDGSLSTGKWRYTGYVQANRPFSHNDTLGFSYGHHFPRSTDNRSVTYGVNYRYPFRDWEFSFRYSHQESEQVLPLPIPHIVYTQRTRQDRSQLQAKKLLGRTATTKEYIQLALEKRESQSDINGVELKIRRQRVTTLTLGYSYLHYLKKGTVTGMLGIQRGIPLWGAMDRIAKESPNPRYTKWIGDVDYYRLLSPHSQYRLSWHGEYSRDLLYDDDSFTIGNRYTVRGISEKDSLNTTKGMYLQQTWTRKNIFQGIHLYGGIDIGIGKTRSNKTKSLVSACIGIQGGKTIRYDVLYGIPLTHRQQLHDPNGQWSLQVSYLF